MKSPLEIKLLREDSEGISLYAPMLEFTQARYPVPSEVTHRFAAEVRPIVQWCLDKGVLFTRDLKHIVADVDDFDNHIIDIAYDSLSQTAREAGRIIGKARVGVSVKIACTDIEKLCGAGFLLKKNAITLHVPTLVLDILRIYGRLFSNVGEGLG